MRAMKIATAVAGITLLTAQLAAAQAIEEGEKLFKQRCQSCHSVTPGKNSPAGPSLIGILGRASGSTDFRYSTAMKGAGITWDAATLDQFLAAPAKLVPGTRMSIAVPNVDQRSAIIAYLTSVQS
jgi:cytochrome c